MLKPQTGIHSSISYILPKEKKNKAVQHKNQSETSERSNN